MDRFLNVLCPVFGFVSGYVFDDIALAEAKVVRHDEFDRLDASLVVVASNLLVGGFSRTSHACVRELRYTCTCV